MSLVEQFTQQFAASMARSQGAEKSFRQAAWAGFEQQGLPQRKSEAWKYSSLQALERKVWHLPPAQAALPTDAVELIRELRSEFDVAVLVNGDLRLNESSLTLEAGYELKRARDFSSRYDFSDGFSAAAVATHQAGFELDVHAAVTRPLVLLHCQVGEGIWCSTFNRIRLQAGSSIHVAEIFLGAASSGLRTHVSSVELAEKAHLTWVSMQEMAWGNSIFTEMQVQQARGSQFSAHPLNAGADWARSNIKVDMQGEDAEAHVNGLSFGRLTQHIDQRIEIRHSVGRNNSTQLFKNILKDSARGIVNGKIHILPQAQKVVSRQTNHNLLLSPMAEADTKPELEIYADDVKANHGASCGRLDEQKLFYLLSRGIGRPQAQQMLAKAFVADVIMKVPAGPLRELLNARVERLLPDFIRDMESAL